MITHLRAILTYKLLNLALKVAPDSDKTKEHLAENIAKFYIAQMDISS